jgi:hypothetical protein
MVVRVLALFGLLLVVMLVLAPVVVMVVGMEAFFLLQDHRCGLLLPLPAS